jgi:hypothetical protein
MILSGCAIGGTRRTISSRSAAVTPIRSHQNRTRQPPPHDDTGERSPAPQRGNFRTRHKSPIVGSRIPVIRITQRKPGPRPPASSLGLIRLERTSTQPEMRKTAWRTSSRRPEPLPSRSHPQPLGDAEPEPRLALNPCPSCPSVAKIS